MILQTRATEKIRTEASLMTGRTRAAEPQTMGKIRTAAEMGMHRAAEMVPARELDRPPAVPRRLAMDSRLRGQRQA